MEQITPLSQGQCRLIGAALGWGAQLKETQDGPDYLKTFHLQERLSSQGIKCAWGDIVHAQNVPQDLDLPLGPTRLPYIVEHHQRLAHDVVRALMRHEFPCVIGGDHSVAVGTWSAVTSTLNAAGNFGLIWIDAHMDAHTPDTSPSQAYHGMPVAALMGYGESQLTEMVIKKAKINPQDLVLIGVRSYEAGEAALLRQLGVLIFSAQDVAAQGMSTILDAAIAHVTKNTPAFGVSIDLDAFDPLDAPGVGSPEAHGIRADISLDAFRQLRDYHQFKALEIVEFNPEKDHDHKTAYLIYELLLRILPHA